MFVRSAIILVEDQGKKVKIEMEIKQGYKMEWGRCCIVYVCIDRIRYKIFTNSYFAQLFILCKYWTSSADTILIYKSRRQGLCTNVLTLVDMSFQNHNFSQFVFDYWSNFYSFSMHVIGRSS